MSLVGALLGTPCAAAPGATEVVPPRPLEPMQVECPDGTSGEGSVALRLDVDREGAVSAVELLGSENAACAQALQLAAMRVRFAPAERAGRPVAARILFRYDFPSAPIEQAPVAIPVRGTAVPSASRARGRLHPVSQASPEVVVHGDSTRDQQRNSAEAITIVETERARRESRDLGEVLARNETVSVRREAGLGSGTRISMNGLTDDQIRFFVDGVPLEYAGFPFGVANVPVSLLERVELYSGVVPVRFGADALGGAINLVSDTPSSGPHASASYQAGSFGTRRIAASARTDLPRGLFARVDGFFDSARNDYPVDVNAPNEWGEPRPVTVKRFHDAYGAYGASVSFGVLDPRSTRRVALRVFGSAFEREYQSNLSMTRPYGDATYSEAVVGQSLRYEQPLGSGVRLSVVAGFSRSRGRFLDVGDCVYDWFGRCVARREQRGETDTRPHDRVFWQHGAYARAGLRWLVGRAHRLEVASTATLTQRTADERQQADPTARDPVSGEHRLFTWVNGVEHKLTAFEQRLENILFVKHYVQALAAHEPALGGGSWLHHERITQRFGFGAATRYRVTSLLSAKTSYELATRLPRPDEVFGDNVFVTQNASLEPEVSHNFNAGLSFEQAKRGARIRLTVNGFLRDAERLIVLTGSDRLQSYQNVLSARSLGGEFSALGSVFDDLVTIEGNASYQDFRNTSGSGPFAELRGDRIPNRPYFFGNAGARLALRDVLRADDELALSFSSRYVHSFFRGWESLGSRAFKQTIPAQLAHAASLAYRIRCGALSLSTVVEVQNLADARLYDFFGVQRPGRAAFIKTSAEF